MNSAEDTIAAIATPLGEGGLGVIRLSGPQAFAIASKEFQPLRPSILDSVPSHTCHVGGWGAEKSIDHVVVTLFRGPNSYTGDDVIEISAHGSPFVLQEILNSCLRRGARVAGPGEFTQRAFLAGKLDLTQAEAVSDLISARTEKVRAAALAQLEGSLATRVRNLRNDLLPLMAHLEVGLDHSDEDHAFLRREELHKSCGEVLEGINAILASARVGKILREGLRVALVGRPNVGKSSLLNALLGEDRAIVTATPGTTRDTLEENATWDGFPVVLTDTAGLRENSSDPIEVLGMGRTKQVLENADLVVGLFDASETLTEEDEAVVRLCADRPHLWAINKTDLPSRWAPEALSRWNGIAPSIQISALRGDGLPKLIEAVKAAALSDAPKAGEAHWILNARHRDALERTRDALRRAQSAAKDDAYEECVALELMTALQAIGEIIGETPTEELLGQIFSQFCVGK